MIENKVVVDTNVIISSLLGLQGNSHKIIGMIKNSEFILVTSYQQFGELYRVLDYDKFQFSQEEKHEIKSLILELAVFVTPKEKILVLTEDPSDNMILECAVEGDVDYIVTGDRALLELENFRGIRILTPRQFLGLFGR